MNENMDVCIDEQMYQRMDEKSSQMTMTNFANNCPL